LPQEQAGLAVAVEQLGLALQVTALAVFAQAADPSDLEADFEFVAGLELLAVGPVGAAAAVELKPDPSTLLLLALELPLAEEPEAAALQVEVQLLQASLRGLAEVQLAERELAAGLVVEVVQGLPQMQPLVQGAVLLFL
jgi:hypothetical protein